MTHHPLPRQKLLADTEPGPVGFHNITMTSDWLFLCEHACNRIPLCLDMLGLPREEINRHIGWDIGALDLAREITDKLKAPLIFQQYSRLVIDCNRPLSSVGLIPFKSENTVIPGNVEISSAETEKRINEIWKPYQQSIQEFLEKKGSRKTLLITLHSFTPVFKGEERPWHIGLLFNRSPEMAQALKKILHQKDPSLCIGMNEPYTVSDEDDYTIPAFGEAMGLPHVLIEIRQDLIQKKENQGRWARLFVPAFRELQQLFFERNTD